MSDHFEGLVDALSHGGETYTLGDVADLIDAGKAQVWRADRAMIVTQINDAPRKRVLHFWLATGKLKDVITLSEEVIEWGRTKGCTMATLSGRRGWVKALADHGWSEQLTVMGREIPQI